MTTRMIKLLGTTTALVAFAATSHAAAAIATSTTTALATSTTTGGIQVTGIGSIVAAAGPAITISSDQVGDNIISVSTGGIISAGPGGATISSSNVGADATVTNAAIVINNSGTIAAVGGNTAAVDLSNGTAAGVTINNVGSISGSVTLGAGDDTLTNSGGTITGAVALGAGANTFTVSGGTVTGAVSGGAGGNTITINNGGTVYGAMSMGNGANSITINSGTLKVDSGAAYTGNGSADIMTLVNANVSGSLAFGGGADALYISGTQAFTTKGDITGLETLGVSNTTMNVRNTFDNALAAVSINSTGRMNVSNSITMSGALTNAGTMEIAAGKNVTAGTIADGGKYVLDLGTSRTIGTISSTGAGPTLTTTSYTINVANTSGYIASGTQFTIVDNANAPTNLGALTASQTGVYRFSVASNGNNGVSLTVGRVSTSSVVQGETSKAIANALDVLGSNASNTLYTVQSLIGQQSTAAGVQNVLESLAPNIDGAGEASIGTSIATGNQISNRLAMLRGSSLSGVATGSMMASRHMWVEGFGSTISQDDKKGASGYDANGAGATFGFDTEDMMPGYTTGASFSYGHGTVDSNASGGASTDIDSYVGTLYGSRVLDQGMFVNGQVNLGYNNYSTDRTVLGVGKASADFNGWQAGAKVEAGKDMAVDAFTVTPMASLQYNYLNMDSYTESGAGGASLYVNPDSMNTLDAGLGGQVAYAMPMENGGTFKPSVHAKYIYRMGDTDLGTTSRFTGGGSNFSTNGVKSDRSSVNLGAGLLLTTMGGVDLSLNYDADIRSSLTGHSGQIKARWAF